MASPETLRRGAATTEDEVLERIWCTVFDAAMARERGLGAAVRAADDAIWRASFTTMERDQ